MGEEFLTKGISSIIVLVIAIGLFMFWISMLIDCANRSFKKPIYKILWILFIAFLQTIGALVYWITVRRKSKDTLLLLV